MSDEVYRKLQEFLDRFPIGFPKTESGVEIRILKSLFSEDEAGIVVNLDMLPQEPSAICGKVGMDENRVSGMLEAMSQKGLIFRTRRSGKTLYNAAPFMIGLYEYSVERMDKELAELYAEYYETAFMDEMGASNVPGFKVIPIAQGLSADTVLYPSSTIKQQILKARKIAVAECICRKEARLTGHECDHPTETCLSFGIAAEYYIENKAGREITAQQAIEILEESDRSGLVHAGVNTKHLSNICNCCPCCCASMKGMVQRGHNKEKYMNALFEAIIDPDECTSCELCLERCPVTALKVEDTAVVDRDKCLGCGLCSSACTTGAISIKLRTDREEPFERVLDLGMAIMKGKQSNRPA